MIFDTWQLSTDIYEAISSLYIQKDDVLVRSLDISKIEDSYKFRMSSPEYFVYFVTEKTQDKGTVVYGFSTTEIALSPLNDEESLIAILKELRKIQSALRFRDKRTDLLFAVKNVTNYLKIKNK